MTHFCLGKGFLLCFQTAMLVAKIPFPGKMSEVLKPGVKNSSRQTYCQAKRSERMSQSLGSRLKARFLTHQRNCYLPFVFCTFRGSCCQGLLCNHKGWEPTFIFKRRLKSLCNHQYAGAEALTYCETLSRSAAINNMEKNRVVYIPVPPPPLSKNKTKQSGLKIHGILPKSRVVLLLWAVF